MKGVDLKYPEFGETEADDVYCKKKPNIVRIPALLGMARCSLVSHLIKEKQGWALGGVI